MRLTRRLITLTLSLTKGEAVTGIFSTTY